jgi:hypothetical protein
MRVVAIFVALSALLVGFLAGTRDKPAGAAACRSHGGLPDRRCTPGAFDRHVTQRNIGRTICHPGYSQTVRPPTSYTNRLKVEGITEYGFRDRRLSDYEEDHLVAISLGGSPTSPGNLWPEPHAGRWNSYVKDRLEYYLYRRVCNGTYRLARAQSDLAHDWVSAYKRLNP